MCPAEICIEKDRFGNYVWVVCQPDCSWGGWYSGVGYSYDDACNCAQHYLRCVHKIQGYLAKDIYESA